MPRTEFTKPQRRQMLERSEGKCEGEGELYGLPPGVRCMRDLGSGVEFDHVEPDEVGGEATVENGKAVCPQCHRWKTGKVDKPRIAKNTRVREKKQGLRKSKRPMPGGRNSPYKIKIGTRKVVAR